MIKASKEIPAFSRPPIVEKLMGIQFSPLQEWGVPHFGLFWQEIRDQFPKCATQPPLPRTGEVVRIEDAIRCWYFHESETQLIQVQTDRFLYNWQKPVTYDEYPRHEVARQHFEQYWHCYSEFLNKNGINKPSIEQCEITYVNHFVKGREWNTLSDLPRLIACWSGMSGNYLESSPELVTIQMSYPAPDIDGVLTLLLQRANRGEDAESIFQLTITASGKPASQDIEDVIQWYDIGREYIVRSFVEFTTDTAHELWGKTN